MLKNAPVALLVLAGFAAVSFADTATWPDWRGPNRDGKSSATGLLKKWPEGGPKLLWKAAGVGSGYSSVTVDAGGTVYTTGHIAKKLVLTAISDGGKMKWKSVVGPGWTGSYPGSRAAPVQRAGVIGACACSPIGLGVAKNHESFHRAAPYRAGDGAGR